MSGLAGSRSWVTTAFEEARHKLTIVPVNTVFMVSRGASTLSFGRSIRNGAPKHSPNAGSTPHPSQAMADLQEQKNSVHGPTCK